MQALFDLKPYTIELPPDPNAPYSVAEMLEFIGEAQEENDISRLNWLFAYLIRHAESYTEIEYKRVFGRHEKALRLVVGALKKSQLTRVG